MTTLTINAATTSATAPAVTGKPQAAPAAPSVHRRALLTWLAVYPTITAAFLVLGPYTAHLPLALRTGVMTALVVPAAVYGLVPALLKADRTARAALASRRGDSA